jgi:hypothetical protein
MKWLIFKRRNERGLSAGWYALHESNGTGAFFPSGQGLDGWNNAVEFVKAMTDHKVER